MAAPAVLPVRSGRRGVGSGGVALPRGPEAVPPRRSPAGPDLLLVSLCWLAAPALRLAAAHGPAGRHRGLSLAASLMLLPVAVGVWRIGARVVGLDRPLARSTAALEWGRVAAVSAVSGAALLAVTRALGGRHERAVVPAFVVLSLLAVGASRTILAGPARVARRRLRRALVRFALGVAAGRPFGPRYFAVSDLVLVFACWLAAYALRLQGAAVLFGVPAPPLGGYLLPLPAILWLWRLSFRLCGLYDDRDPGSGRAGIGRIAGASGLAAVAAYAMLRGVLAAHEYSRSTIGIFAVLAAVALSLSRTTLAARGDGEALRLRRLVAGIPRPGEILVSWLSRPLASTRRGEVVVAALGAALLLAGYLHVGYRSGFIPCMLDCGETYEGYIGALNLYRFGPRHAGGLQDFAASPEIAAHPTVYTHNPNLGMYFRYLLFLLGFRDIHAQAPWTAVPFAAGLAYMYLLVRLVSASGMMAALCLLNAAGLYLLVTVWGFHGLRVFSWVLTFGPAYHLCRASAGDRHRGRHLAAALAYMALSFGMDYPFALFNTLNMLGLAALGLVRLRLRSLVALLAGGFGVPFVLRQAQVALALGPRFWAADFAYSLARRIPVVGGLLGIPDEHALDALYAAHHVLKWPSVGEGFAPGRWAGQILGASVEALGSAFPVLVAAWIAVLAILGRRGLRAVIDGGGREPASMLRLIACMVAAQAVTLLVFGSYVAAFYGSVLMPLLVHWIVPLLGLTTWVLVANRGRVLRIQRAAIPVGAILLALFALWRVEAEVRVRLALPPAGYPGREALTELRGHSVVTVWISSAVSAHTDGEVVGPRPKNSPA